MRRRSAPSACTAASLCDGDCSSRLMTHITYNTQVECEFDFELEDLIEYIAYIQNGGICILYKFMYIFTTYYTFTGGSPAGLCISHRGSIS